MIAVSCGFAALPGNDHCWLNGVCRVCKVTKLQAAINVIEDFAPREEQ